MAIPQPENEMTPDTSKVMSRGFVTHSSESRINAVRLSATWGQLLIEIKLILSSITGLGTELTHQRGGSKKRIKNKFHISHSELTKDSNCVI